MMHLEEEPWNLPCINDVMHYLFWTLLVFLILIILKVSRDNKIEIKKLQNEHLPYISKQLLKIQNYGKEKEEIKKGNPGEKGQIREEN